MKHMQIGVKQIDEIFWNFPYYVSKALALEH